MYQRPHWGPTLIAAVRIDSLEKNTKQTMEITSAGSWAATLRPETMIPGIFRSAPTDYISALS